MHISTHRYTFTLKFTHTCSHIHSQYLHIHHASSIDQSRWSQDGWGWRAGAETQKLRLLGGLGVICGISVLGTTCPQGSLWACEDPGCEGSWKECHLHYPAFALQIVRNRELVKGTQNPSLSGNGQPSPWVIYKISKMSKEMGSQQCFLVRDLVECSGW